MKTRTLLVCLVLSPLPALGQLPNPWDGAKGFKPDPPTMSSSPG